VWKNNGIRFETLNKSIKSSLTYVMKKADKQTSRRQTEKQTNGQTDRRTKRQQTDRTNNK
jgi:hypothetical protein